MEERKDVPRPKTKQKGRKTHQERTEKGKEDQGAPPPKKARCNVKEQKADQEGRREGAPGETVCSKPLIRQRSLSIGGVGHGGRK